MFSIQEKCSAMWPGNGLHACAWGVFFQTRDGVLPELVAFLPGHRASLCLAHARRSWQLVLSLLVLPPFSVSQASGLQISVLRLAALLFGPWLGEGSSLPDVLLDSALGQRISTTNPGPTWKVGGRRNGLNPD